MRKSLFYILSIAGLASCSDDVVEQEKNVLSGSEKTPIAVVTNLSANSAKTRAVNKEFEGGEELLAYLQAGSNTDGFTKVDAFCNLEALHVLSNPTNQKYNNDDNVNYTVNLDCNSTDVSKKIFWDDYSNATYPLTDPNRGIRLYYGYCYNGGSTTTDLNKAAGTIGWTVAAAPTAETFKKSDLLYAKTQEMIQYKHDPAQRGTLVIPYTHAMSKVTIEVICDEGFEADATKNFGSAVVTLKEMNTVCTVTAPTAEVAPSTESSDIKDITMLKGTPAAKTCTYTALITPTVMKAGNTLATIEGVDGNKYSVVLSDEILRTAAADASAWSTKLAAYNANTVTPETSSGYDATNGGITLPGVNYHLEVTVMKQEIKVKATIQDWETVSAAGVGVMDFTANIVSSVASGTPWQTGGDQFNLWRATTDGVNGNYDEITSTPGVVDKATTLTYSTSPAGWTASPKIYWPNNSTSYYFRALAKYNGTNYVGFEGETADHTAATDLKVAQGTDLVWGTTAAHTGTDSEGTSHTYSKGAAINPRTSEVPLAFDHAMSKISVKLESVAGAEGVDVTGAKISIVNIYDGGTVSLTDGTIVDLTASGTMPILDFGDMNSAATSKLKEFCVIPQSLVKDKAGNDRAGATAFYTPNDLTVIYDDTNSSEGTGASKTYVTSTLTPVYYTDSEAKTYNAGLPGAVSTSSDKEPAREYTLAEYNALSPLPHASISEADFNNLSDAARTKEAARPYTLEEFKALTTLTDAQFNALPNEWKAKPAYTKAEADEYNATLTGAVTTSDTNPVTNNNYTAEEAATHNATLTGAVHEGSSKGNYTLQEYNDLPTKPIASINQDQYDLLPDLSKTKPTEYYTWDDFKDLTTLTQVQFEALPSTMRTRPAVKYTQAEADAYNAKLPGAKSTMDVHHYEKNSSSTTAVAGDIKSNGTKVVLHIMLADKTGYTINLATCKDSDSSSSTYNQPITTWERGKHYTYTITLGKEEITFRALIKEWEDVTGGGNATLDW